MLIIDMPKKYLTDASGFVSCEMCEKYLPLLHRDCHKDFKGCLIKGELPEEHGDLIDADAIWERAGKKKGEADPLRLAAELWCAPVIIAAERKDDEQIH